MEKHEQKYCPKCDTPFVCKVGDIANCQCSSVRLSEDAKAFLTKTFYDCLCSSCLAQIEASIKIAKAYHFPVQKEMFIEGLHYYKEGNYWVFTEFYHLLRGCCCKSGCRHCVYGFKKHGVTV